MYCGLNELRHHVVWKIGTNTTLKMEAVYTSEMLLPATLHNVITQKAKL